MKWFIADPHFGHANIIKYCNRPFKNTDQMDKAIIKNYNELVKDFDDVYFLGDFSMATKSRRKYMESIMMKLKGHKHLIPGNHDIDSYRFYTGDRGIGFTSIHYPYFEVEEFILCHDPALAQVDKKRSFLVGHIHNLFKRQGNCLNVGVDVWDFKPVSLAQVRLELIKSRPNET